MLSSSRIAPSALGLNTSHGCAMIASASTVAAPISSASVLAAAALITAVYATHMRARVTPGRLGPAFRAFTPAGVLLAFAYGALVTGFDRGDVGIVAPLNATQSLWAVVFAALLYRHSEAIGRRTFPAGVLVVAGGALIGLTR